MGKLSTRINYDELEFGDKIGEGYFGVVSRGMYRNNPVAIKVMKATTGAAVDEFTHEVDMMEQLRGQFIVTFFGAVITPNHLCLVTEYMPYGNLDRVMKHYRLGPLMKISLASDIANGMASLHASSIMHRDLKPDNILVCDLNINAPVLCKLTDFGTSRALNAQLEMTMTKVVGTPMYMAPEVICGEGHYSMAADVYSYAIMLNELWCDQKPYEEMKFASAFALSSHVLSGYVCTSSYSCIVSNPLLFSQRPQTAPDCPLSILGLIQQAWDTNPHNRPSFSSIATYLGEQLNELSQKPEMLEL